MNEHVDRRALTYAVGASLALHAVLLALRAPEPRIPVSAAAPTLIAHLDEQPEALPAPPAAEPKPVPPPPPKVEKPRPPPKTVRPEPTPAKPTPFTVAPAPAEAPAPVPEPAPAPAPAPAPQLAPPPPPSVATLGTGQVLAAPGHPAVLMDKYRHQLIGAAVRFKRYPPVARDNGWQGEALVLVEIGSNGELADLKVNRSSGHDVLDQQALEMFRLASREVPVPPELRGRAFSFSVRAVYSLKD